MGGCYRLGLRSGQGRERLADGPGRERESRPGPAVENIGPGGERSPGLRRMLVGSQGK